MTQRTLLAGPNRPIRLAVAASALALSLLAQAAAAEEEPELLAPAPPQQRAAAQQPGSIINLQVENDFFVSNDDGQYTHGMRLTWLSAPGDVPDFVEEGADFLPLFHSEGDLRSSFSITQSMYTPDDINSTNLVLDDRPYAGWLQLGIGLLADSGQVLDKMELSLGLVGPYSYAEDTQTIWHEIIKAPRPNGWDHQLDTEPTLNLFYERQLRIIAPFTLFGMEGDIVPHYGGALGNALTYGAAGATIRLGTDLVQDYGPPKIQPSLPGSGFFLRRDGVNGYIFAGVEGRAVARNIFLDGNTFHSSHSVDRKVFVGDLQFGAVVTWGDVRLSLTHIVRTHEFEEEDQGDQFGAISLSLGF